MRNPSLRPGDEIVMAANSGTGLYRAGERQVYKRKSSGYIIVTNRDGEESHTALREKNLDLAELGTAALGGNVWSILPCNAERS